MAFMLLVENPAWFNLSEQAELSDLFEADMNRAQLPLRKVKSCKTNAFLTVAVTVRHEFKNIGVLSW